MEDQLSRWIEDHGMPIAFDLRVAFPDERDTSKMRLEVGFDILSSDFRLYMGEIMKAGTEIARRTANR